MKELELGTGVRWGKDLPSFLDINSVVDQDQRAQQSASREYSILREEKNQSEAAPNAWGRNRS